MNNATPRPDVLTRARKLRASGVPLAHIAATLEAEQYPTVRGGTWAGTQVLNLLNLPRPFTAFLAPCTVCGHLTSSKYGICVKNPACNRAYQRRRWADLRPEDTSTSKPCTSCGRPTVAAAGVCSRPSCWNAYARERTSAQRGGSTVYAVWFPYPRILKVGFSAHMTEFRFVYSVRDRAKLRNWDATGSALIWKQPGDVRTEAWMQATLSFRWLAAFEVKDRICEWFAVPDLSGAEIGKVLDDTYRLVPPDLTGRARS